MTKASPLTSTVKIFHGFHLLLSILSIGAIMYLLFSLYETQNELQDVKRSCALCGRQNVVKSESDTARSGEENVLENGKETKRLESQVGGREIRSADSQQATKTCATMIRDFMKVLEDTKQTVCTELDLIG